MEINSNFNGLIQDPNQVYHNNTLKGKGTKESPLRTTINSLSSSDGNSVLTVEDGTIDLDTNGTVSIQNTTGIIIGGNSTDSNAILQVDSTTQGILFPRMTTAQRNLIDIPPAGLVIYNTSTNKLNVYTTTWEAVTSA